MQIRMTKEELIEKYELENKNILKRRPDLDMNGDFTPDGVKVFCNNGFITELKALSQHDVSGDVCVKCGKTFIPRLFKELTICDSCSDKLLKNFH